ncbi:MAG: four helix bundle protein [Corallococcus sp.]|nr:four helix bundle protein [Corallococcus sp.]MCM1359744.1 four helix bundle protein [Corallococcus sp.]MCM1395453.1 four helix bundle protein [Corallococcus sp.]
MNQSFDTQSTRALQQSQSAQNGQSQQSEQTTSANVNPATEALQNEILSELRLFPEPQDPPADKVQNASRKPFRLKDFDTPRDKELAVITHAKKLCEYLFVITDKSPAKYRWNIVGRLLNTATDVVECLYRANYERDAERIRWQKQAMINLNMLDFFAETAKTKQAINFHQLTVIVQQIVETQKLLSGWVRSTKNRSGV